MYTVERMITKQQLQEAWNTFVKKMSELRKKRQDILVAYDEKKSKKQILEVYQKIVDVPED